MTLLDGFASASICLGAVFFIAGSVGLLRFPGLYSRLHALTKADNLGLGLICFGIALLSMQLLLALKLLLIWLLVMAASAVSSYMIAQVARQDELQS